MPRVKKIFWRLWMFLECLTFVSPEMKTCSYIYVCSYKKKAISNYHIGGGFIIWLFLQVKKKNCTILQISSNKKTTAQPLHIIY